MFDLFREIKAECQARTVYDPMGPSTMWLRNRVMLLGTVLFVGSIAALVKGIAWAFLVFGFGAVVIVVGFVLLTFRWLKR